MGNTHGFYIMIFIIPLYDEMGHISDIILLHFSSPTRFKVLKL